MRWLYKGISKRRKDENGLNISNKVQCEISSTFRGAEREQSCGGERRAKESGGSKKWLGSGGNNKIKKWIWWRKPWVAIKGAFEIGSDVREEDNFSIVK